MTIVELVQTRNVRVSYGSRWMEGFTRSPRFIVMERKPRQRNTRVIIETDDEAEAAKALSEGEK